MSTGVACRTNLAAKTPCLSVYGERGRLPKKIFIRIRTRMPQYFRIDPGKNFGGNPQLLKGLILAPTQVGNDVPHATRVI